MISQDTIFQIKSSAVIQDVIGGFIKLKKEGADFKGLCPFHTEKSPSFSVSPSKNIYKCFGCGKSGDSTTFVMEHEHISYIEAIKWLANRYNIEITEETARKSFDRPLPRLKKCADATVKYFEESRGISNNTLLRFKVTDSMEWMPKAKTEIPVICFNYYRKEELINIKFRGKNKDFLMTKNAELIFYNLDAIENETECFIVEGEIDCMSLHEAGIYNVVSVPNGAGVGQLKLEYLDNCWGYFENKKKVVLMTDNDEPGLKLRDELARRIGYDKCFQVEYTNGCKDSNEVLVKHGKMALLECIDNAAQWPIHGLVSMDDMFTTVEQFYEQGYPKGYAAGLGTFDDHLTFYPGQLTMVTGIPGSGKSEFVDWIMASLSKKCGWDWGICSFETPPEFHVTKLAEKFTDKSFAHRVDPDQRMNRQEFEYAIAMIDKHFHFINLSLIEVTMDGLIAKAEELVKRRGINGLLFDPWNCIEAKYGENETETKYVLTCLNKLIIFADKYKVHVFLVAHPTKLQKDKQTGKYEIPTLYSISGSAHFFNRTHNGISIWRDFQSNVVDVYIQKVKWSWLGKLGNASFSFNPYTRKYTPLITGI